MQIEMGKGKVRRLEEKKGAFVCSQCRPNLGKTFTLKDALKTHTRDVHKHSTMCGYKHCYFVAESKNALRLHKQKQH